MAKPGLFTNRKLGRLVHALAPHSSIGGEIAAAGVLELLWNAAYDQADEHLGDAADVEAAAKWHGPRGVLVRALLRAGGKDGKGFLEPDPEHPGQYIVHDFWEHAPRHVRRRLKRNMDREAEGKTLREVRSEVGRKGAQKRWQVDGQLPLLSSELGCADLSCAGAEQPRARTRTPAREAAPSPRHADVGDAVESQGADPGSPRAVEGRTLAATPGVKAPGAVPVEGAGCRPGEKAPRADSVGVPDADPVKSPSADSAGMPRADEVDAVPSAPSPGAVPDVKRLRCPAELKRGTRVAPTLAAQHWPKTEEVRRIVSETLKRVLTPLATRAELEAFERFAGLAGVSQLAAAMIQHAEGKNPQSMAWFREFAEEFATSPPPAPAARGANGTARRRRLTGHWHEHLTPEERAEFLRQRRNLAPELDAVGAPLAATGYADGGSFREIPAAKQLLAAWQAWLESGRTGPPPGHASDDAEVHAAP